MAVAGWPRALAWSDFQDLEERPPGETENAQVQGEIQNPSDVEVRVEGGQRRLANFTVRVTLVPAGTWAVTSARSPALLRHEQVHWDVEGLVAHELHRALEALRAPTAAGLQQQATAVIARMQSKIDGLQRQYDRETDHGRRAEQQARWERIVDECKANGNRALPDPA